MARFRFLILLFFLFSGCLRPISRPSLADSREWADLVEGTRLYESRNYSEAARLFLKMIDTYPGTPLLAEAQWLLAKSYGASGKKEAAVEELQAFLRNFPGNSHLEEARSLLFRLENSSRKVVAAYWFPSAQKGDEDRFDSFKREGINTVMIAGLSDLSDPSARPDRARLQDGLAESIQRARLAGFQVIVRLPLREMSGLARSRPEWSDRQFDQNTRQLRQTAKPDLFNDEVRAALLRTFRDLAFYPIDGIYVDAFTYRIDEGWTHSASNLYRDLFLEEVDPVLFLNEPIRSVGEERPPPAASQFWHWVGWRSRFINDLLKDIRKEVESARPGIRFGVALPEIALLNPARGLAEFSIDFLELKRSKFDFYLVSSSEAPMPVLLGILSRYAISPREIWIQTRSGKDLPPGFSGSPFQGFVFLNP